MIFQVQRTVTKIGTVIYLNPINRGIAYLNEHKTKKAHNQNDCVLLTKLFLTKTFES